MYKYINIVIKTIKISCDLKNINSWCRVVWWSWPLAVLMLTLFITILQNYLNNQIWNEWPNYIEHLAARNRVNIKIEKYSGFKSNSSTFVMSDGGRHWDKCKSKFWKNTNQTWLGRSYFSFWQNLKRKLNFYSGIRGLQNYK